MKNVSLRKMTMGAAILLLVSGGGVGVGHAQETAEKQGAQQAREGRDQAVNGRDTGNVREADAGAAKARQGAANSGGNREAHENAREAAQAARDAHEHHDSQRTPQADHKGGGGKQ